MYDVIIVGAGAAGLMCAVSAGAAGKKVLVIEKNRLPGRKIRITGKGRCNITNDCEPEEVIPNIPGNGKFLYSSFHRFSNKDVIRFFDDAGVETVTERGNRVFPKSGKAADVAEALFQKAKSYGATFLLNERVKEIKTGDDGVTGVQTETKVIEGNAVVIATGGCTYPLTGSDGNGYRLAEKLGHHVTELHPSLVGLTSDEVWMKDLQGLSLRNIGFQIWNKKDKPIYKDFGEMLFTGYGISGPVVLSGSRHIPGFRYEGVQAVIDLKPALDEEMLDKRLQRDFTEKSRKQLKNAMGDLLPSKLIPVFIQRTGIDENKFVHQLTKEDRKNIASLLKEFRVRITGSGPMEEAIVTSGGISVKEINPSTMESKLVKGLYFAGEIIDVDGYTGGFNLTIAFSTGWTAGVNA